MAKVLITAFEPYDRWAENASWLTLVALTKNLPETPQVVTRRYPVNYEALQTRLAADLQLNFDYALFLGQAPGSCGIRLEAVGLNLATGLNAGTDDDEAAPLVSDGPAAYRSPLPLAHWAAAIRAADIPAQVSYHAGTYLCNAALYLACHIAARQKLKTRAAFLHLPLAPSQASALGENLPSLPVDLGAEAIQIVLREMERPGAARLA